MRLKELGKKFDVLIKENEGFLELKPRFNFLKRDNVGVMLWIIVPISLVGLIFRTGKLDLVLGVIMVIVSIPMILAVLTILRTFWDVLKIYPDKIEFVNSFEKTTIEFKEKVSVSVEFRIKKRRIKYVTRNFTLGDFYIRNNGQEYRFFDLTSDTKNSVQLKEFTNLIMDEINKRSKTKISHTIR